MQIKSKKSNHIVTDVILDEYDIQMLENMTGMKFLIVDNVAEWPTNQLLVDDNGKKDVDEIRRYNFIIHPSQNDQG